MQAQRQDDYLSSLENWFNYSLYHQNARLFPDLHIEQAYLQPLPHPLTGPVVRPEGVYYHNPQPRPIPPRAAACSQRYPPRCMQYDHNQFRAAGGLNPRIPAPRGLACAPRQRMPLLNRPILPRCNPRPPAIAHCCAFSPRVHYQQNQGLPAADPNLLFGYQSQINELILRRAMVTIIYEHCSRVQGFPPIHTSYLSLLNSYQLKIVYDVMLYIDQQSWHLYIYDPNVEYYEGAFFRNFQQQQRNN